MLIKCRMFSFGECFSENVSSDDEDYSVPLTDRPNEKLAFKNAEGFGSFSKGGRDGELYMVESLDGGDEKGTLRYGVEKGRRPLIIRFSVSGTIDLKGEDLKIKSGKITIDGSDAPGKGICLTNGGLVITANDVIVRYIRSRPMTTKGDAISIRSGNDIIVDHCSCSWAKDEVLTLNPLGETTDTIDFNNVTVSNCFIYEPFGDGEGEHRFGSIIAGGDLSRISFIKNLYASCDSRVPRMANRVEKDFKDPPYIDFRNNVVYNWGKTPGYNGEEVNNPVRMNFINNSYLTGPSTRSNKYIFIEKGTTKSRGFFFGNLMDGERPENEYDLVDFDGWSSKDIKEYKKTKEFTVDNTETFSPKKITDYILENAGCNLPQRDTEDLRIIDEVRSGDGSLVKDFDNYFLPNLD